MEDIDIAKNIVSFGINKALFSIENLESGFLTRICRNNFSKEQLLEFQYELRHITNEMANQRVQALGISNVIVISNFVVSVLIIFNSFKVSSPALT